MKEQLLLRINGLKKSYGKKEVLKDVALSIKKGQVVGIVGENGAGKSTLLKILVGLLHHDGGDIERLGTMGYCPQDQLVFPNLTVKENFHYFAASYGLVKYNWEEEMDILLEKLNFAKYKDYLVSKLSGGSKQKLNLAIAMLHSPDILVLDEPYSGFDWETYLHFWELSKELRDQGKGVIVVSHIIYDYSNMDIVYQLREGVLHEVTTH